jgi:hypothetical protein
VAVEVEWQRRQLMAAITQHCAANTDSSSCSDGDGGGDGNGGSNSDSDDNCNKTTVHFDAALPYDAAMRAVSAYSLDYCAADIRSSSVSTMAIATRPLPDIPRSCSPLSLQNPADKNHNNDDNGTNNIVSSFCSSEEITLAINNKINSNNSITRCLRPLPAFPTPHSSLSLSLQPLEVIEDEIIAFGPNSGGVVLHDSSMLSLQSPEENCKNEDGNDNQDSTFSPGNSEVENSAFEINTNNNDAFNCRSITRDSLRRRSKQKERAFSPDPNNCNRKSNTTTNNNNNNNNNSNNTKTTTNITNKQSTEDEGSEFILMFARSVPSPRIRSWDKGWGSPGDRESWGRI